MAWELSNWLVLTRTFQLVATLAAALMNGFLVAWIHLKKLGLGKNMVVNELMILITLIYTTLALIIQHTGGRSRRSGWLTCFIVSDAMFIGAVVGLITVLARAGLPVMCVGLTSGDFGPDDRPDKPGYGYTTIRFSDEMQGHKGELDRYCAFERSVYFIAIGLIFTLIITIVLSVLRICEASYTKNTRVNELLDSLERANEKEQQSPLLMTAPRFIPPPSEGIITRQTSIRSVATTNHSGAAPNGSPPMIPRRPVPNRTSGLQGIPSPIDEVSETRDEPHNEEYDALVADGMRHGPSQQHHYSSQADQPEPPRQQPMPMLPEESDRSSLSDAGMVADGMQYRPNHQHTNNNFLPQMQQVYTTVPLAAAPLDEESAALVSDGSRPMPNLPPYTPGSSRTTSGPRRAEDSGMRFDDFGIRQAPPLQDMKSTGYFKQ
ncbi:hypothetical protein CONLIGDRAFT_80699 [Coniochaeta ligniaria NRRL 30616]|uniref:Uncharacterized protein n=1 Tax=Coniochaeta ligniaria NRRL 30616 TaxID=1408157 RepID=A0A1J7IC84_9PEZI|nr:hypothetical protein CONLIGDRAFT_80699 [Coniochaeta ligniaria NRRL 30616]